MAMSEPTGAPAAGVKVAVSAERDGKRRVSVCAGTADCTMIAVCFGSIPAARNSAASSSILALSSAGSWYSVIACRSTMPKIAS